MAKVDIPVTIEIRASFDDITPRMRQLQARELVEKALNKDERIAKVNEDIAAGRIRVPSMLDGLPAFDPGYDLPPFVAAVPRQSDPTLVDGLTPAECLERFTLWHREGTRVGHLMRSGETRFLSAAQIETARAEWSRRLREKVKASAEKERMQVVCDWQDEP